MIERRSPHQVGKEIAKGINNGNIKFFDKHLSMFPVDLMYGWYTMHKENNRLDVAIVEASAITEDGGIIPGASVGASPEIIQMADKGGPRAFVDEGKVCSNQSAPYRSLLKSTPLARASRACTTSP